MAQHVATAESPSKRNKADFEVNFGAINEANIDQLRKLNVSIFPVRYNDKFYDNVLTTNAGVTQVTTDQHGTRMLN